MAESKETAPAHYDTATGKLVFTAEGMNPARFAGTVTLRMLFADGAHRDVETVPAGGDTFSIDPPGDVAVGSVRWQLVRTITTRVVESSGLPSSSEPLIFTGATLSIRPKPDVAVVVNRTSIDFVRQDKNTGRVSLLDQLAAPDLGAYLYGSKVQPVAFSGDLSRVYVGGRGRIRVFDMVTFRQLESIAVPGDLNVSSLVSSGDWLFIGEGSDYGQGHNQLLVMNTDPGSEDYNQLVSIKGTGVEASPLGISGMAVGADGETLVIGVPKERYLPMDATTTEMDLREAPQNWRNSDRCIDPIGKVCQPGSECCTGSGRIPWLPNAMSNTRALPRVPRGPVGDCEQTLEHLQA